MRQTRQGGGNKTSDLSPCLAHLSDVDSTGSSHRVAVSGVPSEGKQQVQGRRMDSVGLTRQILRHDGAGKEGRDA